MCVSSCLSGGVIMLVAHPSPPPALLSRPPSLFIYPGLIQSSGRSVCRKGSLPRQPSVTEQCIRTLRHPLLRKKKINQPPPDALEAEKGTSHTSLNATPAGSATLFPSRRRAHLAGLVCLTVFLFMPATQEQRAGFQTNR